MACNFVLGLIYAPAL